MANTATDMPEYELGDGFDLSGEEDTGTTRTILRVNGEWDEDKKVYTPEPVSFTAHVLDKEYEATYAQKRPSRLGGLSRRLADYSDGSGEYSTATGRILSLIPDIKTTVGGFDQPLDLPHFLHELVKVGTGNTEMPFAAFMSRLRQLRLNLEDGSAMFFQQRGTNMQQWQRSKNKFLKAGGEEANKSGRIVEAYSIDRRKMPLVFGFDLGQDDLTRSNPPGRGFLDPLNAIVNHLFWSAKTDAQRRALVKEAEGQEGDEQAKTQAEIDRLARMLRNFNLAGIDQVHERKTDEEGNEARDDEGRYVMIPTNRYRSAEAPIGMVSTSIGDLTLWGRRGAATTEESPSTEDARTPAVAGDEEPPF